MTEVIFWDLKKRDAKLLRSWWDANTLWYHFVVAQDKRWGPQRYTLIRQL